MIKKIKQLFTEYVYKAIDDPVRRLLDEEFERPGRLRQLYEMLYAIHSNAYFDRSKLVELRNSKNYLVPFDAKEPLVSIRVPTLNRAKILTERTIPSFLNQSYKNIEIVIVGDHCTDDTEERIKKMNNKKIKFYNLPYRGLHPTDPMNLWRVAGSLPANEALQLTTGQWISPCDDDDEYYPNHIEDLLKEAKAKKMELVYGNALSMDIYSKKTKKIGIFPPDFGSYSYNASIFHQGLKFFEYDPTAWVVGEVQDWNLCRKMMQAGVKIGYIDKLVTKINFAHYKKRIKEENFVSGS